MSPKVQRIIGWVLSVLISAFLMFGSASGKFMDFPGKAEMFEKIGWSEETIKVIGVVEIVIAVLFLIPRTAFLGAILLTGYLGGAIATHVRIGDPNWLMPSVMGFLAWVGLALRKPVIFRLAIGSNPTPPAA